MHVSHYGNALLKQLQGLGDSSPGKLIETAFSHLEISSDGGGELI